MTMFEPESGHSSLPGSLSSKQQSVADHNPVNYDPSPFEVSQIFGFRLTNKISRHLFVFRFLITKYDIDRNNFSFEDKCLLNLLYESIFSYSDPSFKRRNSSLLDKGRFVLKHLNQGSEYLDNIFKLEQLRVFFLKPLLLSHFSYFGWRKSFNVKDFVKRFNRNQRRKPPPLRRIGVGYRDHGTARDVAYDGSPTWQEVASSGLNRSSISTKKTLSPEDVLLWSEFVQKTRQRGN